MKRICPNGHWNRNTNELIQNQNRIEPVFKLISPDALNLPHAENRMNSLSLFSPPIKLFILLFMISVKGRNVLLKTNICIIKLKYFTLRGRIYEKSSYCISGDFNVWIHHAERSSRYE